MNAPSPTSLPEPEPAPAGPRPGGFARLGNVLARRTTDLLAIAIVTVGLLAVAGPVSHWWSTDPQQLAPTASPGSSQTIWGRGGSPVALEFGDLAYTLRRQTVRGTLPEASGQLLAVGRELAAAADVPPPMSTAERELLAELQRAEPTAQGDGWKVYRFDLPLPMVLGVRQFPAKDPSTANPSRAEPAERVVCWGRAFPEDEQTWSLFLLHAPRTGTGDGSAVEPPLPPGSRRSHALRDGSGLAWIGFEGQAAPQHWIRHFDQWTETNGWRPARPWQAAGGSWSARFVRTDGTPGTLDVQFTQTARNQLSGLIAVTP